MRIERAQPARHEFEPRLSPDVCTAWMHAYVGLKLLLELAQKDLPSIAPDDVRDDGLHRQTPAQDACEREFLAME